MLSFSLSLWWGGGGGGGGGFLVITVSHPTFCCVGVGLWLRWGWAVTTLVSIPPATHEISNLPSIKSMSGYGLTSFHS